MPRALPVPSEQTVGGSPQGTEEAAVSVSDEEIYQSLIQAIVDQRLLPGTKLVEDKLGQVFGVSRTRIRQVLIRLAQEQIVTLQPNKGASIVEPSVEEAREVFEARTVVEVVLVRRFMTQQPPAVQKRTLAALTECIEAEEAARKSGDQVMALRLSGRFHLLLAEAAGHAIFARFLRELVSRTSLILMSYGPSGAGQPKVPSMTPAQWVHACRCEEHRGLLTALRPRRANDTQASRVETAVQLMQDHLSRIEASLCFSQAEWSPPDWVDALTRGRSARDGRKR